MEVINDLPNWWFIAMGILLVMLIALTLLRTFLIDGKLRVLFDRLDNRVSDTESRIYELHGLSGHACETTQFKENMMTMEDSVDTLRLQYEELELRAFMDKIEKMEAEIKLLKEV